MENEIDINEIENLVSKMFKGQATILDKWYEDTSFTQECFKILNSPDVLFNSAFFAILVLLRHVDRFFCFWEPSARFEFAQFVQGLATTKESLLINNPPLLGNYSKLAGSVIAEGWDGDPRFQGFLVELTQNKPTSIINNKISLNILEEVSESMRRLRVSSFDGAPLASIIDFSYQSLNFFDNNKEIICSALKTILSALNFYANGYENKSDDLKRTIALNIETQNILINSDLIQQLFSIAPIEPSLCFEILTLIISCNFNTNIETKKAMIINFANQVINCIELDLNSDDLNQFFRLILRLKMEIDYYVQLQFDYVNFIQKVFEKSKTILDRSSSFQEDKSTVGNILSFFETVDEGKFGDLKIIQYLIFIKMTIIKAFSQSAMSLLTFEEQIDANSLGLDESEHFHSWFMSINKIIKKNSPEMLDVLFKTFDSEKTLNTGQVSFMCLMILAILYDNDLPKSGSESEKKFVVAFSGSLSRLLSVYKNFIVSPYIITSFLLFIRHLENFNFLCNCSHFSHLLYLEFEKSLNISTCEQMLQFLLEILFTIFQNCDQKIFILDGCKALSYLFDNKKNFYPFIIRVPIVLNIVKLRVESPFPFLLSESHSQSRMVFHSSIATILVNKDASDLRSLYLSIYDSALIKPDQSTAPLSGTINESVWAFLCDFTGFFKFTKTKEEFNIFFYYLFSHHHFESLISHINDITTSPSIFIQFLKFWNALLDNKIEFRHHSPDGLILFHFAVDTLKGVLKSVMPIMTPGADLTRKTVYYIFLIINSLLSANYVPFACFDRYNDTGLIDLLTMFNICLGAAPPLELTQYPKLEKVLMRLNIAICSHHIEYTAKPGVECTVIILDIINYGLSSNDSSVREDAITCLAYFMKFRGIYARIQNGENPNETVGLNLDSDPNAGLIAIIPKEKLILSTCGLWHMLLTTKKHKAIEGIQEIIQRLPEVLDFVHSKMQQFLIQDQQLIDSFENSYREFYESCSFMFQSGETMKFKVEITKFVNNALKCLRAPTKVFTII